MSWLRRCCVRAAQHQNMPGGGIQPNALFALKAHPWPGNVRELCNVLKRAVRLAGDGPVATCHLHMPLVAPPPPLVHSHRRAVAKLVPADVDAAMAAAGGDVTHAAKLLCVHRTSLHRWLAAQHHKP